MSGSQHLNIDANIQKISGVLYRLVESQQQIATTHYTDNLAEQNVLEQLLDNSKPAYPNKTDGYHYLLKTPFRYPPLKWGSRFGNKTEPSIFYGGLDVDVTLAESAYYRFVFWHSIDAPPIKPKIQSQHTLFSARYATDKGVKLHEKPFASTREKLTSKSDISYCQTLGTRMRELNVKAFEYESARFKGSNNAKGLCVGLFEIQGLIDKKPLEQSAWLCELTAENVSFKQLHSCTVAQFPIKQFLLNNAVSNPKCNNRGYSKGYLIWCLHIKTFPWSIVQSFHHPVQI